VIVTAQCWLRQGQGSRSFRADYALCNPERSRGFEQTRTLWESPRCLHPLLDFSWRHHHSINITTYYHLGHRPYLVLVAR